MTFWLEHDWQEAAARNIADTLSATASELLKQSLGNRVWTPTIFRDLAPCALDLCNRDGFKPVCSFGGGALLSHGRGWLYDFCCWIEGPNSTFLGLPIVVESEWTLSEIHDDFDKLNQARAGLRVFIFEDKRGKPLDDWIDDLLARARMFTPHEKDDAWLFACLRTKAFECKFNRTG